MGEGYLVICAIVLGLTLPILLIHLDEYQDDMRQIKWLEKQRDDKERNSK